MCEALPLPTPSHGTLHSTLPGMKDSNDKSFSSKINLFYSGFSCNFRLMRGNPSVSLHNYPSPVEKPHQDGGVVKEMKAEWRKKATDKVAD